MRKIGGLFNYEPSKPIENGYFSRICSPNDDLAFTMSGRCGIYYCLQDIALHDTRKVAYVPLYTCETVLAPFEKAGYQLKFYELDKMCIRDRISSTLYGKVGNDSLVTIT